MTSFDKAWPADETVWYRADLFGLVPGQEATFSEDQYVYVVSDLNAARAYAAIREHQFGIGRSVYRVRLLGEVEPDPDYRVFPEFVRSVSGILEEVIEPRPTMSPDEATEYICQTYNPPWPGGGGPMYDSEGYPTASAAMLEAGISATELRHVGKYKSPLAIGHCAERLLNERGREHGTAEESH
jgi:hypothetical protein